MIDKDVLRIFVAMPFSDEKLGPNATWKDSKMIESFFYLQIGVQLSERLNKKVEVFTERIKDEGLVKPSMFREAMYADIYIADLTGNNANVFLELGVRWALRDNVTVVTSQKVDKLEFNVQDARVIFYDQNPFELNQAIKSVVNRILDGLNKPNLSDSPVRAAMDIVQMTREEKDRLENRIKELEKASGEELMIAAEKAENVLDKISLLNEAIKTNAFNTEARIKLGVLLRKTEKYGEALDVLEKAISIDPVNPHIYQQIGIVYSKTEDFEKNVDFLRHAERLSPNDPEILRNLGGALRKLALKGIFDDPEKINWSLLTEAKQKLDRSLQFDEESTYGLLNAAKLHLMLAKRNPEIRNGIEKHIRLCQILSEKALLKNPDDYWAMFDWADTFVLQGNLPEALAHYQKAVDLIPPEMLKSDLSSPIRALKELHILGIESQQVKGVIENILEKYEPLTH